jgi:hypothetical protein
MVTTRGAQEERIAGLDFGAGDYVVKPFASRERVARMSAVLRRSSSTVLESPLTKKLGNVEIDRRARSIRVDGELVVCTPREYGILSSSPETAAALLLAKSCSTVVGSPLVRCDVTKLTRSETLVQSCHSSKRE